MEANLDLYSEEDTIENVKEYKEFWAVYGT